MNFQTRSQALPLVLQNLRSRAGCDCADADAGPNSFQSDLVLHTLKYRGAKSSVTDRGSQLRDVAVVLTAFLAVSQVVPCLRHGLPGSLRGDDGR